MPHSPYRYEGTPRWFKFGDRAELYLVENLGQIPYFYIAIEDWCLECDERGEIKLLNNDRSFKNKLQAEKDLLRPTHTNPKPAIRMALYFLDHATVIEPRLRVLMLKRLSAKLERT